MFTDLAGPAGTGGCGRSPHHASRWGKFLEATNQGRLMSIVTGCGRYFSLNRLSAL